MRMDDMPESGNVEDRRGDGGGGFGGGGMPMGAGGLGIGGILVLGIVGWALGIDPRLLISGAEILTGGGQTTQQPSRPTSAPVNDDMSRFVRQVLGSTEVQWKDIFQKD